MKTDNYLTNDQKTINVIGEIADDSTSKDYIDNKGYVKYDENSDKGEGVVWIYSEKGKPLCADKYPFFWFEDNEIKYSNPDEFTKKAFSVSNVHPFDVHSVIVNTSENEQLFDEKEIADMNAAASFFIPIINPNDDFLKKIVKTIIIKKNIDISRLKSKTDEKYQLPNMKAALISDTSMSVKNFSRWMSLLGCEFQMIIDDDPEIHQTDNLNNSLLYQSDTNKMYEMLGHGSDIVEVDQSNYSNESSSDSESKYKTLTDEEADVLNYGDSYEKIDE